MSPSEWILGGTFLFFFSFIEWRKKTKLLYRAVDEYNRWEAGFAYVEVRDGFVSTKAERIKIKTPEQVLRVQRDKRIAFFIMLTAIAMFAYGCYSG